MSCSYNQTDLKKTWLTTIIMEFGFLVLAYFSKPTIGLENKSLLLGISLGFLVGLVFFIINRRLILIKNYVGYQWWLLINLLLSYFLSPIKENRYLFFLPYFIGLLTISTIIFSIILYKNRKLQMEE